jgi:SAM-dependent methyltransferase
VGPGLAEGDLEHVVGLKTQARTAIGWSPRLRRRFGYYTPDEWYEATVFRLVEPKTDWLDVGCGRDVFRSNYPLAQKLAARCRQLTGLDPSDNIDENALVHEKVKSLLEDYRPNRGFDLITLSMVAEHITDPRAAVQSLAGLTRPGGRVVIYTVNKWSPVTLLSLRCRFLTGRRGCFGTRRRRTRFPPPIAPRFIRAFRLRRGKVPAPRRLSNIGDVALVQCDGAGSLEGPARRWLALSGKLPSRHLSQARVMSLRFALRLRVAR